MNDTDVLLRVHVASFSYKRGYPREVTGHGGGFVFDCRVLPNPGRMEQYRTLSGCDLPVAGFLESLEEFPPFWSHVVGLADIAVKNYLQRGFTDLSVAFGCTGGQHRSVYFAERLTRHLGHAYRGVEALLSHRERELWVSR